MIDLSHYINISSAGVGFTLEKKFQGIFSGILSQLNAKKWKQSACCLTLWCPKIFFLSFSLKVLEKVPLYEKITH
jgi:hypothetical protein